MTGSAAMLIRALNGPESIAIAPAADAPSSHRLTAIRRLGHANEMMALPSFDGARLALPETISTFPDAALNRAAYLWLAAQCAFLDLSTISGTGASRFGAQLAAIDHALSSAAAALPGLTDHVAQMNSFVLETRPRPLLPPTEAAMERQIRAALGGQHMDIDLRDAPTARSFAPVAHWLLPEPAPRASVADRDDETQNAPPGMSTPSRKRAIREGRDEANRRDSFIMHRFESIFSWVESLNLNRMIDDSDEDDAAKAADDQDNIVLSRHDQKTATRLKIHLDLAPQDVAHEELAGVHLYPEWDAASQSYLPDHCRVLEAPPKATEPYTPDANRIRRVRRQFEALRPRRIHRPRQIDGEELDFDALVDSRADLIATGQCSDRIYRSLRATERDLSVAILMDTSRSTESAVGDSSVIDISRDALAALSVGIDASGDRLGVWGFSSLKRDRVFLNLCKDFDTEMSPEVIQRIGALKPAHYTRLGAAMRHVSNRLDDEQSQHRLLLVLTDGKPNDLDHYEGRHGIEDCHRAVREARARGQTVHGVIIDEDGQDWFARIFGRGSFSLLPNPERLTRALPDIYRSLIQES